MPEQSGRWPQEKAPEWIDSHCHLADPAFAEDLEAVLQRAAMASVQRMVVIGDSLERSGQALDLCVGRPGLRATAGVHPHNAKAWSAETAAGLRALIEREKERGALVALGEIGLDYHYGADSAVQQRQCFLEQCSMAREFGLPLVIHVREAFEDFLAMLREESLGEIGGVVHCYSGTPEAARSIAEAGLHLGVGGILTFKKNETLCQSIRKVPLEALVIETDSPYLAPTPHRGKRNEPALLVHVVERMVMELGRSETELSEQLMANTLRCFRMQSWDLPAAG